MATGKEGHSQEISGAAGYTVRPPGYRLPDEIALGPVLLQVADMERSIAYYDRVVGLRTLRRQANAATLGPQDADQPMVELHERRGATPVPRRGRLGLYHFAILLPDRASLGRFAGHLAALGEYAGMADHLVSEAFYLTDPDGLGIEVYADRPPASWVVHGGKLAMATDPLDLEDLARAAGEGRWAGAPPGTRIGHIHLYVDDLGRAGDFYHRGLGLDRIGLDFPGALFMSAGGYHHHLGTNTWAAGAPRATVGDARLLEWSIRLPGSGDVARAARSLADAGYRVAREGSDALAADPWGTNLRLTTV
jgi:catechol 2,3-dioxygenase